MHCKLRLFLTILLAVSSQGVPVQTALFEALDGAAGALFIVGDGARNLTESTVENVLEIQDEVDGLVADQLTTQVKDAQRASQAAGDVILAAIAGARQTAKTVRDFVDDSVKGVGKLADDAATSALAGSIDVAVSSGDLTKQATDSAVQAAHEITSSFGDFTNQLVDNSRQMAIDASRTWQAVARNALRAFTRFDLTDTKDYKKPTIDDKDSKKPITDVKDSKKTAAENFSFTI